MSSHFYSARSTPFPFSSSMESSNDASSFYNPDPLPFMGACDHCNSVQCACPSEDQFLNYLEDEVYSPASPPVLTREDGETEELYTSSDNESDIYDDADEGTHFSGESEEPFEYTSSDDDTDAYDDAETHFSEVSDYETENLLYVPEEHSNDDETEENSSRCSTPVQDAYEVRWEQYVKHLSYTDKHRVMEEDAETLTIRDHKDTCFTIVRSEEDFIMVSPFGLNPVYQKLAFPVDEHVMVELYSKLPSWVSYRLHELRTEEGLQKFAHDFAYIGPGYRLSLLMRRAMNEAINRPELQRRLDETLHVWGQEDDLPMGATPGRRREHRAARDAAAAADGRTPFGVRRPMRQRVLFRDEEEGDEKRVVKRRRLDLDD